MNLQRKTDTMDTAYRRAAELRATSFNEADNTVEVIWTTGARVRRYSWNDGPFDEELEVTPQAIRLDRLNAGAPFLDTHDGSDLSKVIGSVVPGSARVANGVGTARILLSATPGDADTIQKIRDGIIRNVSVGYRIHRVIKEETETDVALHRVVDWEPMEISAVPIPADAGAQIRSADTVAGASAADQLEAIIAKRQGHSGGDTSRAQQRAAAIENALLFRDDPERNPLTVRGAQDFVGMSLVEVARECLEANGISASGMSRQEIAEAAMQVRSSGMQTVDAFPTILANVLNKSLRFGYEAAPQTFRPLSKVSYVPDFKEVARVQLSEAPTLEPVGEHGQFKHGDMGETSERFHVETFGKIVSLTRQTIINDDIGAFTRIPRAFGVQAAQLESDVVWAQIIGNPTMCDGLPLFHSKHKNLLATDWISKSSFSEAFLRMGLQTGTDEATFLNFAPVFLIVPKVLQTDAETFLEPFYPAGQQDAVPPSFRNITVISEARLDQGIERFGIAGSEKAFYFSASPSAVDLVEVAYLDGQQGVFTETRTGFEVDGIEIKCRLDIGAKAIDWRGFSKNSGR